MANIGEHSLKKFKLHHFILLLVIFFLVGVVWFIKSSGRVSDNKTEQRFVIAKGSGASLVGANLKEDGLLNSPLAFKLYVQLTGKSSKIQAGEYSISPNLDLFQLVELLLKGPDEVWVTIPEGLRHEEIAFKMAEGLALTGSEKEKFIKDFLTRSSGLEGYLFPDTYLMPRDISASVMVNTMRSTFDKRVDFTVDSQDIIVASILERETLTAEERPIVAGILIKRLNAGWPLQADATIQYAIASSKCLVPTASCDWWPRPLSSEDLKINSQYNTYKNPGLPPTPISNPGLTSIKAAANPETSSYWFYIHDSEGKIHYAATIEEHNANVTRYLR